MKNQFSTRGLLTCTSPGPRQPLDPGLFFLVWSCQKFLPYTCELACVYHRTKTAACPMFEPIVSRGMFIATSSKCFGVGLVVVGRFASGLLQSGWRHSLLSSLPGRGKLWVLLCQHLFDMVTRRVWILWQDLCLKWSRVFLWCCDMI